MMYPKIAVATCRLAKWEQTGLGNISNLSFSATNCYLGDNNKNRNGIDDDDEPEQGLTWTSQEHLWEDVSWGLHSEVLTVWFDVGSTTVGWGTELNVQGQARCQHWSGVPLVLWGCLRSDGPHHSTAMVAPQNAWDTLSLTLQGLMSPHWMTSLSIICYWAHFFMCHIFVLGFLYSYITPLFKIISP